MSCGSLEQHVIARLALNAMHYSRPLRESHDDWIIGDNDGISDGHFPEIQTHNILIRKGTFYRLLTSSLEYLGSFL